MNRLKFSYSCILFGGLKDRNRTKSRSLNKMDKHLFRKTKLINIQTQKNFSKRRFSKTLKSNRSTRNLSYFAAFFHSKIGVRKIVPEENCTPVRVRVWFRISGRIRAGEQFSQNPKIILPNKYARQIFSITFIHLFFYQGFFNKHRRFMRQKGSGNGILIHSTFFIRLANIQDIGWTINAENSPHIFNYFI